MLTTVELYSFHEVSLDYADRYVDTVSSKGVSTLYSDKFVKEAKIDKKSLWFVLECLNLKSVEEETIEPLQSVMIAREINTFMGGDDEDAISVNKFAHVLARFNTVTILKSLRQKHETFKKNMRKQLQSRADVRESMSMADGAFSREVLDGLESNVQVPEKYKPEKMGAMYVVASGGRKRTFITHFCATARQLGAYRHTPMAKHRSPQKLHGNMPPKGTLTVDQYPTNKAGLTSAYHIREQSVGGPVTDRRVRSCIVTNTMASCNGARCEEHSNWRSCGQAVLRVGTVVALKPNNSHIIGEEILCISVYACEMKHMGGGHDEPDSFGLDLGCKVGVAKAFIGHAQHFGHRIGVVTRHVDDNGCEVLGDYVDGKKPVPLADGWKKEYKNLGGFANVTFLDGDSEVMKLPSQVIDVDTEPESVDGKRKRLRTDMLGRDNKVNDDSNN